jgi:hypothetical protein
MFLNLIKKTKKHLKTHNKPYKFHQLIHKEEQNESHSTNIYIDYSSIFL